MPTSTHQQLAEAIHDALGPFGARDGAVDTVLDALAVRPRTLREFADQQGPAAVPARWPSGEDPARWLRGACSSGDPLHAAVAAVLDELALLRSEHRPRVWHDVVDIPEGTHVLDRYGRVVRPDEDTPEIGPVVEVVLPDYAAEVARATTEAVQAR